MRKCRWGGQSLGGLLVQSRAVGWERYTNVLLRQHGAWLSSKVLCVGQHTPKEEEGTIQDLHKSMPEMSVVIVRHCRLIESCVCYSFVMTGNVVDLFARVCLKNIAVTHFVTMLLCHWDIGVFQFS